MKSPVGWWTILACWAVLSAGRAPAADPKVLTICAVPASMPRTGKAADGTGQGLDVEMARLLGRRLGRPVEFHWCASAECSWNCLPERRCDIVVGQPLDSGPRQSVAWSVPYAGSRFGLVVGGEGREIRSLDDLRGRRVGIVAGTVALSAKDHEVVRFPSREAVLDGFETAKLDAALVDADFAAWYLHGRERLKGGLRIVEGFVPRERWNIAVAVRAQDGPLLVEINRALAGLAEKGEIARIYAALGVPFHPPWTAEAAPKAKSADANTWARIRERGVLVVSMDPANLPYSSARGDRPGFDVELAGELARRLGVKLRLEWLDIHRETAVGALVEGRCDLVLGAAVDPNAVDDEEALADKVVYSRPYYGTGYLLVGRRGDAGARSLAELKTRSGVRIGTEAGSVADYTLRQRGFQRRLYRNQLATLKALDEGDLDFAYLWANVGWTLHASPELKLQIVPDFVLDDHWNVAAAVAPGNGELKRRVDAALEAIAADGTVKRAVERYHVPYFAPFADTDRAGQGVLRHPVAERGREPQMARVQTSKHGYEGLERVRAAGELVVGLDQANLPFSTAHPAPGGLDYEVAGLLAEQLGLRLRVYWAYSAHDSYPSKLAAKKLCDVILGVIPDDRFAGRVLYSRPYHHASYQQVVPRGSEGRGAQSGPVAVEEGVAVRGLGLRENGFAVRSFPSTEAILEAVAAGRVPSGYVISTRGPWLASTRWPGALAFVPASGTVDRFPVCAVVRKSDGTLKEAIDRAWVELDRSGRLAQVFDRWHIPYDPASSTE